LGHYFLAVALGENREEARAAAVFSQVRRLASSKTLKWSASFERGAALLRHYTAAPAQEAATQVLEPLIAELEAASSGADPTSDADASKFASRLLPMAYAQLAYVYGTLFTLQSGLSPTELAAKSQEASRKAMTAFTAARTNWSSEQERREVERWLYNTRGYSTFRIAQYERMEAVKTNQPIAQVDKAFRDKCEIALVDLHRANEILPNHYGVLQNEAMILDDQNFDPDGKRLREAEALYERTKLFVPRDYYQYERLGLIYWRQLRLNPPLSVQSTLVEKGKQAVSSAAANRHPDRSRTAAILTAYFQAAEADLEPDADKKRATLTAALDEAEGAAGLRPPVQVAHDTAALLEKVAGELAQTDPDKVVKERVLTVSAALKAL
jgi:hypothetical protein